MKKICIHLILVLLASSVYGASITCYVSKTGSNTPPYSTPGTAASNLGTCISYIRTHGDSISANTINIGPGTYSSGNDYAIIDDENLSNLTISGSGTGSTILNPSGASIINASIVNGLTISNLTLNPVGGGNYRALYYSADNIITITDVDFMASNGYQGNLIYSSAGIINATRCRFFHQYDNYRNPVRLTGTAGGTFIYCISTAVGHAEVSQAWLIESSGEVDFYNCIILDSEAAGMHFSGTGASSMYNCIINGGVRNSASYTIETTNRSVTLFNNLIIANPWDGDNKWISGPYSDGGGNLFTNISPEFTSCQRRGFILPRIDDSGSFSYAQSIEPLLANKGMKGTYFLEKLRWKSENNSALRTMVSNGTIEIGSHSFTHSDLSVSGKLWDITKGIETITIDRESDTITLSGRGSVYGFKSKTLEAIKLELIAMGVTVTASSIYATGSGLPGTVDGADELGESIADATATKQVDLLIDITGASGYFKTEITDPKAWLADIIINDSSTIIDPQTDSTYTTRSFGLPYNANSSNARSAVMAAGYSTGNGGKIGGGGSIPDVTYLGDIDLFAIVDVSSKTYVAGSNEAETRYKARALAFVAAHTGLAIGILAHSTAEMTIEQWTWALDEWSKYGADLIVTSRQCFRDIISASGSGWTNDGDGTYSRIYKNVTDNYALKSTSPCINTGADMGLATDFDENPIEDGIPDIGAFEYQHSVGNSTGLSCVKLPSDQHIDLMINTTNGRGDTPIYEWLPITATINGNSISLYLLSDKGIYDLNTVLADIYAYTYSFGNSSVSYIGTMSMSDLGLNTGDEFIYGYLYMNCNDEMFIDNKVIINVK